MKKIVLAFDDTNFSEGAINFACRLNEIEPVFIVGLFLPQAQIANVWSFASIGQTSIPLLEVEEAEQIQKNITRFEGICKQKNNPFRIHKDFFDLALPILTRESKFADLVILGSQTFYSGFGSKYQEEVLEQALHDMRCPILIVPEHFDFPENIVLAYDGSYSSVFAIKQFSYLFPNLSSKDSILVFASNDKDKAIPHDQEIRELAEAHFKNLSVVCLPTSSNRDFNHWMHSRKSAILVCGSFGRPGISQLFKKSFITELFESHLLPVFFAHR
jgi:hypothetical protein